MLNHSPVHCSWLAGFRRVVARFKIIYATCVGAANKVRSPKLFIVVSTDQKEQKKLKKFIHMGTNRALSICLVTVFVVLLVPSQAFAGDGDMKIYIPLATSQSSNASSVSPDDEPNNEPDICTLNQMEQQVAESFMNADAQNRDKSQLVCNSILAQVARERAEDMARRGYFDHTNPDGFGPNRLVTDAGYQLPDLYSPDADGNNIESIAAGYTTAAEVWSDWMSSDKHRMHLMAEHSFYAAQVEYGIGYFYMADSEFKHYWVVLAAAPKN